MPNKIRRWPRPEEPRQSWHLAQASSDRGAGPWKLNLLVASATGSLSALSSGLILETSLSFAAGATFEPALGALPGWTLLVSIEEVWNPWPAPLPTEVDFVFSLFDANTSFDGSIRVTSPDLLVDVQTIPLVGTGVDAGLITGDATITPANWDA